MNLQNEEEHEGGSFEAYFRDPASASDSPLAWAIAQRLNVLDALRGLFSGPVAVAQLRVWCFMELVSVPHGRITREDLNQLFYQLLPQALDNVLKRFRDSGLLVWDATSQDYNLSMLARQVHGLLAPLTQANANERPVELAVKHANELLELAKVEGDAEQLTARLQALQAEKSSLDGRWHEVRAERDRAQAALDQLQGQRQAPPPEDVSRFLRVLRQADIAHHVLADVIEITDSQWRDAAEGVLRGSRWVVVLKDAGDEVKAMELAERERYRHYVVAQAAQASKTPAPTSLLAVLRFADTAPTWLLRQLEHIRRVASPAEGSKQGGEWITPKAYWRDGRGGRSVWVDPSQHQFGAAAVAARRESIEKRLSDLDTQMGQLAKDQTANMRQLKAAAEAAKGVSAASELARRSDEFEQARQQLPHLTQARKTTAQRWQKLDLGHGQANDRERRLDTEYQRVQSSLEESERNARRYESEWEDKRSLLRQRSGASTDAKVKFPARWIRPEAIDELRKTYQNATQARLRGDAVEKDLTEGIRAT